MVAEKASSPRIGEDDEFAMSPIESQFDVLSHPAPEAVFDDQTVDHDVDVVAFILVELPHFFEKFELAIDPKRSEALLLILSSVSLWVPFSCLTTGAKIWILLPQRVFQNPSVIAAGAEGDDRLMVMRAIRHADPGIK
jgi:hypothetical protein